MMQRCWDGDRAKRMSAVECWQLVDQELSVMQRDAFDVFFSHRWGAKAFLCHVCCLLRNAGYKVWYDQTNMEIDGGDARC